MGSKKCMLTASESLGMNVNILSCIVSVARFDHRGVLNAIKILGVNNTFGETVNANLLTRVYRLAEHQNEESLRLAVKDILSASVDLNKISPHQLESIIAMGRGQIDRLVDVVKKNAAPLDKKLSTVGEGADDVDENTVDDGTEKEETSADGTKKRTRIGVVAAFLEIIRNDGSTFQELDFMRDWKALLNEITELDEDIQNGLGFLQIGRVREPSALKLLSDDHFNITSRRDDVNCRSTPTKILGTNLASLLIGIAR